MAATDITFQADQGTAEQLPQGQVGALNEALPTVTAAEPFTPGMPADAYPGGPTQPVSDYRPATPDEEILFAENPGGPVAAQGVRSGSPRLPSSIIRYLPLMKAAAAEPDAPPALKAVYAALVNTLDREMRT